MFPSDRGKGEKNAHTQKDPPSYSLPFSPFSFLPRPGHLAPFLRPPPPSLAWCHSRPLMLVVEQTTRLEPRFLRNHRLEQEPPRTEQPRKDSVSWRGKGIRRIGRAHTHTHADKRGEREGMLLSVSRDMGKGRERGTH